MVKLGVKLGRAFSSLGNKVTESFNRLGEKDKSVLDKVGKFVRNPQGEINHLAKDIVLKSGGITDGLRIGTDIGDKILSGAVGLGAGNIPVYGKYIQAGQQGMSKLAQGAAYLDSKRDQEEARLKRNAFRDSSRDAERARERIDIERANQMRNTVLEKMNGRKQAAIVAADDAPTNFF